MTAGALALVALPAAGLAESLDEIVVTATRLETTLMTVPASVSVIGRDDVQLGRQLLGLDESLAAVPGVFLQDRYNFAQDLRISIRGFGARSSFGIRGVKIVVDGIPESLPDGQAQSDGIDLGSVERIEVLRGPSSALYGNASGGVISITTERPPEQPFVATRLMSGADGFRRYALKAGGRAGRVGYMLNASDLGYDGFREHAETENTQFNARFDLALGDDSRLGIVAGHTDQPVANDPGGVNADDAAANPRAARPQNVAFDAGEALDQQRLGVTYEKAFNDRQRLTLRNYYLWRDFGNRLPFENGGIVRFDRLFAGGGAAYEHDLDWFGRRLSLATGLDVERQRDERQRFDNLAGVQGAETLNQIETVTSTGAYAQARWQASPRLTVTAGLRFDSVRFDVDDRFVGDGDDSGARTLEEFSPMFGVSFAPSPAVTVFGTVSTAFETPTTTEFANPAGGGFNPAVEPQQATNRELGVRGSLPRRSRYELAAFVIDVEDELIPFELAGQPGRDFFANAGESERRGIEAAFVSEPVDGLTLTLAYTWSEFEFERFVDGDGDGNDFSGNALPGIPEQVIRGEAVYRHPAGWFAGADVLSVDEVPLNNAGTVAASAYTVANLRAGFSRNIGAWQLAPFFGINNLNDETYSANVRINAFGGRFFEPAPERNFYAGVSLRYDFGGD
ncbi:MAG: TonB-dependent receptor [Pseudomonadota bacterium]